MAIIGAIILVVIGLSVLVVFTFRLITVPDRYPREQWNRRARSSKNFILFGGALVAVGMLMGNLGS